jgi:hypothetical protein
MEHVVISVIIQNASSILVSVIIPLKVIFVMPQKHKLKLEMKQLVTLGVQMMYNMEKDVVKLVLKNVTTHVLIQIIYIIPL